MANVHRIKRLEAGTEASAGQRDIDWSGVAPLRLEHALWLDAANAPETEVQVAYTEDALHARFRVFEADPVVRHRGIQVSVHKDSCVEWFLQPLPETDGRYLNFEWNAEGSICLGLGENRNRGRVEACDPQLFDIRIATGLSDAERGPYWTLQFSVPFGWLRELYPAFQPESGHRMRANFYKCGDETPKPHYRSWNFVTAENPDFHRSQDFGDLVLE